MMLVGTAAAIAAPDIVDPEQRRAVARSRTSEQIINTPGTVRREGKYWVQEVTGSIPASPKIRVESGQGGIELQGGNQGEITYTVRKRVTAASEEAARKQFAEYPLVVRRRADIVQLSVESDGGGGISADFKLVVPKSTALAEVETLAGAIVARDIDGLVRGQTAGGNIEVDRLGSVEIETAGGNVAIGTVKAHAAARTAGGNIRVASTGANADLATAGGNIDVGHCGRSVHAETAGGSITVGKAVGDVVAKTAGGMVTVGEANRVTAVNAGGNIQVDRSRSLVRAQTAGGSIRCGECGGPVQAETTAGTIKAVITAPREAWAESVLETSAGDIIVFLPANLALTVRAAIERASRRHGIVSDFPLTVRSGSDAPGPREIIAEGAINGGGAPLRIRTVTGNIEIKKTAAK